MTKIAALLLTLSFAACHEEPTIVIKFQPADLLGRDAAKPVDAAAPRDMAVAAKPAPACKSAADCVAVPKDCCDCKHGGALTVTDKAGAAALKKSKACKDQMCAEMMSTDASCDQKADCVAGHCALVAPRPPKK